MIAIERRVPKPKSDLPPLANGDHLDQKTFHERYEAMPPDTRAELIGGVVFMSGRRTSTHGRLQVKLCGWLSGYEEATPGVEGYIHTTQIMADDAEPEPDACLVISSEYGGQVWVDADEYANGAPEWIAEISDSTESIDLNAKKRDYEAAGVHEYVVVAVRTQQVFWFIRRRGKFKVLPIDDDGILRSEVFPGLWLDPDALLKCDGKRLLAVLRQGLASPAHAAFVAKLAAKKK